MLRELGDAAGLQLRTVYAGQAEQLQAAGVQPLDFTVRASPGTASQDIRQVVRRSLTPHQEQRAPAAANANHHSLARLVAWARRLDQPLPGAAPEGQICLIDGTLPTGEVPPLNAALAVRVMERLFALLASQASLSAHTRRLVQQLDPPARRLAARDPGLWRSLNHPWWQFLDRVVSADSVQEEVSTARTKSSLDRVVERLAQASQLDAAEFRQALTEVDFVITGLLDERSSALAPEAVALHQRLDRDTLKRRLREQMVEQLRSTPAPENLCQFLLGPWAIVLADAAVTHGNDSDDMRQRAELVDALIVAGSGTSAPVDVEHRARLFNQVRQGLAAAQFSDSRIEAELANLSAALEQPGPLHGVAVPLSPEPIPIGQVLTLHEGLPTVPIDAIDADATGSTAKHCQAWLDGLEPGDYCRIFLLERWMTTQLTWRSPNRSMFVFSSRHASRLHSMTRRTLGKLRAAGLATTIEHGQMIAQAMDTLTDSDC